MHLQTPAPAVPYTPPSSIQNPVRNTTFAGRRVLVVEDDVILARFLDYLLRAEGFDVSFAHSGPEALKATHDQLDVVILDLNLPGLDGMQVLEGLRQRSSEVCVLVLTGRSRCETAVQVLEGGADDCLHKPFSHTELLARLRAMLRRQSQNAATEARQVTVCGGLSLHRTSMRVLRDGAPLDFTPREYALLEFLMRSPGVPVERGTLLREVWGDHSAAGSNVVDVYMKYLRDKIDRPGLPRLVHTVRGVGYVLRQD